MAQLNYKIGTGANDYVACIIAPAPQPGQDKATFRMPGLRVFDMDEPVPAEGVKVNVPAGAPQVLASLRDAEGNVPANVMVTVTKPDGVTFSQSTEPYDPTLVVQMQNGSLSDLLVTSPQAGEWTIKAESTNTDDEYQFFFSTLPTSDVQNTIDTTLSSMADMDAARALLAEGAEGESWGCFWCKLGCYALGVVVLALTAAGATYVTAGAAPIVALAAYLGISATAAAASVIGIMTGVALTLGVVITYICTWASACP